MPDVPKRCPKCGAPYRKFFSRAHSYYCDSWVEPETGKFVQFSEYVNPVVEFIRVPPEDIQRIVDRGVTMDGR